MEIPLKILFIEDNKYDVLILVHHLKKYGYNPDYQQVCTAETLKTALNSKDWNIITSDCTMPVFDAFQALDILQQTKLDIPFIIVSGTIGEETAVDLMRRGARDFVLKDNITRLIPVLEREVNEFRERQLQKEHLLHSEARFRKIFEESPNGILLSSLDEKILKANSAICQVLGYSPSELAQLVLPDIISREDYPAFSDFRNKLLNKETVRYHAELRLIRKDRQTVWANLTTSLLFDNDQKPLFFIDMVQDISEKKVLEAQLLRTQRMEGIGKLAGGIAHDLNNLLTPILMSVELLRMHFNNSSADRILNNLESNVKKASDMIRQVLLFAKGAEGEKTPVNMSILVNDILSIIGQTFPKKVELETEITDPLWQILADPTKLNQVLLNLCINARDAMPEGGKLTISLKNMLLGENSHTPELQPGKYLMIKVRDTGVGIPDSIINKIFEPFFSTKEFGKGTGLGLSTVYGIIKSFSGSITVSSELNKGTSFLIYLPAIEPGEEDVLLEKNKEFSFGKGELLLIIDDEFSIQEVNRLALENYNYRVISAGDGVEAVIKYSEKQNEIQAVICDMNMPVMDGFSTIKVLQKINPAIKIIASSGLNTALNNFAYPSVKVVLAKPYDTRQLLNTLRKVIEEK